MYSSRDKKSLYAAARAFLAPAYPGNGLLTAKRSFIGQLCRQQLGMPIGGEQTEAEDLPVIERYVRDQRERGLLRQKLASTRTYSFDRAMKAAKERLVGMPVQVSMSSRADYNKFYQD